MLNGLTSLSSLGGGKPPSLFPAHVSSALSLFASEAGVSFPSSGDVAIEQGYDYSGEYAHFVWQKLARGLWLREQYDYITTGQRISCRKAWLHEVYSIYRAADATTSGAWSPLNTSTVGPSSSYVSNTARSASAANAHLEFDIEPDNSQPYDVFVFYMQRTSGGFVVPTIDGSQTLVDSAIVDPKSLGERAFSTYGTTDLLRAQRVKIASNLTGDHTVRLRVFGNSIIPDGATAGTGYVYLEAVGITADIGDTGTAPPMWAATTSYTLGDEVRASNGLYYRATTTGTSGSTEPTHTSSTASDGGVTWSASSGTLSSYWYKPANVDFVSEREYAITNATISATSEDIGGQTHGNDSSSNRVITVDGTTWNESTAMGTLTTGKEIKITADLDWTHSQQAGSEIASGTITTTIKGGYTKNEVAMTVSEAFTASGFYVAMLPYNFWDPVFSLDTVDTVVVSDGADDDITDHASSDDTVNFNDVLGGCVYGEHSLTGRKLANAVMTTTDSIDNFANSGQVFALVNQNAIPTDPPSGGTVGSGKLYFERASSGSPESFSSSDEIVFESYKFWGTG